MSKFSLQQMAICMLIKVIERIVNSKMLVRPLNLLSGLLYRRILNSQKLIKKESSLYEGMHVAFIPDGNRRWYKQKEIKEDSLETIDSSIDSLAEIESGARVMQQNKPLETVLRRTPFSSANKSSESIHLSNSNMNSSESSFEEAYDDININQISSSFDSESSGIDITRINESKNYSLINDSLINDSMLHTSRINDSLIDSRVNDSIVSRINNSVADSRINDSLVGSRLNDSRVQSRLNDSRVQSRLNDSRVQSKCDSRMGKTERTKFGFKKVNEIVKFAYLNRMKEVSFYGFSLKNLNREKSDVDAIMDFIKNGLRAEFEIPFKFKLYGKVDLLDKKVREVLEDLVEKTKMNTELVVNLFFAYSSSDTVCDRMDFNSKVDLVIRTSGVKRLSDFMVRQVASGTAVDFVTPFWPEYSLVHVWLTLAKYKLEQKYLLEN
jgi:undecaprenyl pyrophosphate synthase